MSKEIEELRWVESEPETENTVFGELEVGDHFIVHSSYSRPDTLCPVYVHAVKMEESHMGANAETVQKNIMTGIHVTENQEVIKIKMKKTDILPLVSKLRDAVLRKVFA